MILGNPLIINCPTCKKEYTQTNVASGNTFGGVFWSDGSFFAPMFPDLAIFTRCTECKSIFNIQTAPVHEADDWEDAEGLPDIEHLGTEDLWFALNNKIYTNKEEEIYLRKRLWWRLNHHPWKQEKPMHVNSLEYKQNNEALIRLLDGSDDDQLLMQAELHRNLGNFTICLDLIDKLENKSDTKRISQIQNACKKNIRGTFQLKD